MVSAVYISTGAMVMEDLWTEKKKTTTGFAQRCGDHLQTACHS